MKKQIKNIVVLSGIMCGLTGGALAASTFSEKCPGIAECIPVVSELTGERYLYDLNDVKGKLNSTSNLEITSENADELFSQMLDSNGLIRVPLDAQKTYRIIKASAARDIQLPRVSASETKEPSLPNTWDWFDLSYEVSHPEAMDQMGRIGRVYMPANTAIVGLQPGNKMLVTGPAPVLKKVYSVLKEMDRPLKKAKK